MRTLPFDDKNVISLTVSTPMPPQTQEFRLSTLFPTPELIERTGSVSSLTPNID